MPIFNKREARRTLPIVEDSTWALGSHKWRPNIGVLTKKRGKKNIEPVLEIKNFSYIFKEVLDKKNKPIIKGKEKKII